jgi:hypothetical protein
VRLILLLITLALADPAAARTHVLWRLPSPGSLDAGAAGGGDTLIVHSVAYPAVSEADELARFPGRVALVLWSRLPGPHDLAALERIRGSVTFVLSAYPTVHELGYLRQLTGPDARTVIAGAGLPPALDPVTPYYPLGVKWPDRNTTELLARFGEPWILILKGSTPDHVMAQALEVLPASTRVILNAAVDPAAGWVTPPELVALLHRELPRAPRRIAAY